MLTRPNSLCSLSGFILRKNHAKEDKSVDFKKPDSRLSRNNYKRCTLLAQDPISQGTPLDLVPPVIQMIRKSHPPLII